MIRYVLFLFFCFFIGCNNISKSHINKKSEDKILNDFINDFIKIKTNVYDFDKIKYIKYGDSLAFKYWVEESKVDSVYLKKQLKTKKLSINNSIFLENPSGFSKYVKYKHQKYNKCELLSIDFLIFNEDQSKVLISHSLDCTGGYIEIYAKNEEEWFLFNQIGQNSH